MGQSVKDDVLPFLAIDAVEKEHVQVRIETQVRRCARQRHDGAALPARARAMARVSMTENARGRAFW